MMSQNPTDITELYISPKNLLPFHEVHLLTARNYCHSQSELIKVKMIYNKLINPAGLGPTPLPTITLFQVTPISHDP